MFRHKRSLITAVAVAAVALTILSGCSSGAASAKNESTSSGASGTVTFGTAEIAASLDPATISDKYGFDYESATYDTLLTYNPSTKKYDPDLAKSWTTSGGGTTFTFNLRKGVKFHDGSSLTASGVKASLDRTIAIGEGYSYLLSGISQITTPGPLTLQITLKSPNVAFLNDLTQTYIVSALAIKEHSGTDNGKQWFASHDAGSGPYRLTSYQPNSQIVLTQFSNYWGGWSGKHVKQYIFKLTDPTTQVLDLKQGTIDIADSLAPQDVVQLKKQSGYKVYTNLGLPFYLTFNMSSPKLQNQNVREAIAEAIPYNQIIDKVMLGFAGRLSGPASPWMSGANTSLKPTPTDAAKAKKLLAAAGYTPANPLNLSYIYYNGETFEQTIATAVQSSLKAVGVNLSLQGEPWPTLVSEVQNPATRPDMGSVALGAVTPDVGPILTQSFNPSNEGSWQYWGYSDKATVALLNSGATATSSTEQASAYDQAQKNLADQYASVWLMNYPAVLVGRSDLKNVTANPFNDTFDYYTAYKQ